MNVKTMNSLLAEGNYDREDMWPRIVDMESKAHQFRFEFGLSELPAEPGLIIIRGPRQYGKSTWLDMNLRQSAEEFGKGSAHYLNGDEIASADQLDLELSDLYASYSRDAGIKRLFIDEITAVPGWETAVKRVIDRGFSGMFSLSRPVQRPRIFGTVPRGFPAGKGNCQRVNMYSCQSPIGNSD